MSIWDPCQRVFVQIISLRMGLPKGSRMARVPPGKHREARLSPRSVGR